MFGQQSTTGGTTGTPSLFGTTAPSQGQQGGGFSFGAPAAPAAGAAPTGGFSFNQPPAKQAVGGFSFGYVPGSQPSQPSAQANPSFSFAGNAAAKPAAAAGGFSFGGAAPSPAQAQQSVGGGFSLGAAKPAAAATGFSFGAAAPATSQQQQQPAAAGFSLGGMAPGGFQQTATSTAAAPAGGFSFGTAPSGIAAVSTAGLTAPGGSRLGGLSAVRNATSGNSGQTLTGGFELGGGFKLGAPTPSTAAATPGIGGTLGTVAPAQPTQTATSIAAAGGLGGGLGGGNKLGGFSLPTTSAQSAATSAPTGFKLGTAATSTPGGLTLGASTTSTTGGLGGGLKLGGLGAKPGQGGLTMGTPSTSTTLSTSSGLGLLGAKPTATTAGTGLALGAKPTAGVTGSTAPTETMSYRELEECINKWTVELEEQEKSFLHQAAQVNAWDRTLVTNGEKITSLHNDLEKVKADQQRLEHELDYIVAQQRELEDILVPLEAASKTQEGSLYRQHTDIERERTYQMSENIDSQLKRMVQDLKEIIDHMNSSSTAVDQADPINQIAKILNAHMNSLQWVDQNTGLVQRKVDEVSRQYEIVKRDQERNVHLAFE